MESLWLPRMAYSFRPLSAFLLTLMINIGVGYAQQKVCPGQAYPYGSQPNNNATYWIEFFITNGTITSNNSQYASFTDSNGNWSYGYPSVNVRWDNNGQQGNVKVRYHWEAFTWPFHFSYDSDYPVNIGTPAPTYVWIDSPDPDAIPCSRSSFVVYTDDLSAWNGQYTWSGSNVQLYSNNGRNAVFSMNSNTLNGSVSVQITNSQCPNVSGGTYTKSYTRTPANPTIFGLSTVRPGTQENYSVDGGDFQSWSWQAPSDWTIVSQTSAYARLQAGNMENMDGDIYFFYTDACGYSGQASKYVNTSYSGGRLAAKKPAQEVMDISVNPNPVEQQFTVKIPGQGSAKVSLINSQGKEYFTKDVDAGDWQYNARLLPAGLYILNIKTSDRFFTKKIVKIE